MPSGYDGEVKIGVKLKTDSVKSEASKLGKEINDAVNNAITSGNADDPMIKKMDSLRRQAEKSVNEMEKLSKVPTPEYQQSINDLKTQESLLDRLVAKQEAMRDAGKTGYPAYENLIGQIKRVQDHLSYVKEDMRDLEQSGNAYTMGQGFDSARQRAEMLTQQMGILLNEYNNPQPQTKPIEWGNKFKALGNIAQKVFSKIKSGIFGTSKSMKKSVMTLLKYTLGIRSLFFLFRKIRGAAKEAFNEMAKQIPEVNQNLSQIKTAFNGLKASMGTALQPLLSAISGLLTTVINKVTQLATALGGLFARFTGQNYIYKATAQQVDYAKSLDKTGASAKKASKQLAGFDELNVLNTQNDGGSGGGGELPMATYEKVDIPDNIKNIADWIKSMWKDGDFTELGNVLGEKLKLALESINWEKVQSAGKKVGKAFATLINGFVEVKELGNELGKTIGEALNTGIYTIESFLENFHGISFGKFIGDMIHNAITTTDWGALGHTLGLALSNLMDMAIGLLSSINFAGIGDAIYNMIKGIDWSRLILELGMLLWGVVTGALQTLFGLVGGLFDSIADVFDSLGMNAVAGFFRGMADNLRESARLIGEWFNTYIVEPVKKFLGIHSPSTLFADIGVNVIIGLLNGIKSKIQAVKDFFVNAWNSIKTTTTTIFANISSAITEKINSIRSGISNVLSSIQSTWSNIWNNMKNTITSVFSGIWNSIRGTINSILSGIQTMANGIVSGINKVIRTLNNLSFTIPSWVPGYGGNSFGFNIPTMSQISLPRLAQGAVIPPNKEFMAVLGDQKSGTNVEAPLETIKQALSEVMSQFGGGRDEDIVINIDGYEVFRAVRKQNTLFKKSTGLSAF